jgi:hypothetical protein
MRKRQLQRFAAHESEAMGHSKLDRTRFPGGTDSVAGKKWGFDAGCAWHPIDRLEAIGDRGIVVLKRNEFFSRFRLALLRFLSNGIFILSSPTG